MAKEAQIPGFDRPVDKIPLPAEGLSASWRSPSNIALVKYWGKKGPQLPSNPSVSLSLSESVTHTKMSARPATHYSGSLTFTFEGREAPAFQKRIENVLLSWSEFLHLPPGAVYSIDSSNTFPHSAGIASSASAMSALALCVVDIERQLGIEYSEPEFYRKASFLARLGSGSASRSVYPVAASWGEIEGDPSSSDLFATALNSVADIFRSYRDTILIVSPGEKAVSSSTGHKLMDKHPYAVSRFQQASRHTRELIRCLEEGSLERFIEITEQEALSLHGLMMSSDPGYILLRPGTLEIIQKIREFRRTFDIPVCFTLDAGPNVHLLYPETYEQDTLEFIDKELRQHCEGDFVIFDKVGTGPDRTV